MAFKGPGSQYRIEVRTGFGSLMQVSDGANEWIYQVESNSYVKRPLPPDWPKFPKVMDMAFHELSQAWYQRAFLEDGASATNAPPCCRKRSLSSTGVTTPVTWCGRATIRSEGTTEYRADITYWISCEPCVPSSAHFQCFTDSFEKPSSAVAPKRLGHFRHGDDSGTTADMFRFTPPADAKEEAT